VKSKELYPAIFSRHAEAYQRRLEEVMSRREALGRVRVMELVEARPGMRVLDLACGPGTLSRRLAPLVAPGGEIVGVDLAEGMIKLARAAAIPNATFEVMDIERLSFPNEWFDAAICGHGLQFAADLDAALREARRVLRPGARLAASTPLGAGQRQGSEAWALLDEVVDRWLPPAPQAADQKATRTVVADRIVFGQAALGAGFRVADVEVVEERVVWESADELVSLLMSWWDCAARMEGLDPERRKAFAQDAVATLRAVYPGVIETTGRNHVLLAVA
jgi:SAM-dependent methyltransferase